jgi:hypothetical protein
LVLTPRVKSSERGADQDSSSTQRGRAVQPLPGSTYQFTGAPPASTRRVNHGHRLRACP